MLLKALVPSNVLLLIIGDAEFVLCIPVPFSSLPVVTATSVIVGVEVKLTMPALPVTPPEATTVTFFIVADEVGES